ncbi:MAG: hypothetical protein KDI44_14390 [Thiothrix sp.]|nr:hypothetical protein [Thiothrix sp.]
MPVIINPKQHGLFVALEATPGTYVAPTATAYLMTEGLKVDPNQIDKETITLDSLNRPSDIVALKKRHTKAAFRVPLSWAAAAPSTTANLLPVNPLLQVCGGSAPVAVTTPAAGIRYDEVADTASVLSASLSYRRRRNATQQYERKIPGCRGSAGFEWEFGKIPMFVFDLMGGHIDILQSGALNGTPGTQLTNIGLASSATNTANVLLNGKSLCLYRFGIKNLFRTQATIQDSMCGTGALADLVSNADLTLTFRHPDIVSELNPDAYFGGNYPFTITCKGDGAFAARQLIFDLPLANIADVKEVDLPDNTLGIEMTLTQLEPLTLTHV